MTDYLRSMAAYVATQSGHSTPPNGHPAKPTPKSVSGPDTTADSTTDSTDHADTEADEGWTR